MKKLFMIGGTMGVGKSTVCQRLKCKLPNSVFLDGDWCWNADPFVVTSETKKMVIENICALLNNFLKCSVYENIIFCWDMHEQSIINAIISRLSFSNCHIYTISLICTEEVLIQRLQNDIAAGVRTTDIIEQSVSRIPLFQNLDTIKIDTTDKTAEDVANEIALMQLLRYTCRQWICVESASRWRHSNRRFARPGGATAKHGDIGDTIMNCVSDMFELDAARAGKRLREGWFLRAGGDGQNPRQRRQDEQHSEASGKTGMLHRKKRFFT